jgi:hypothetical protein
MKKGFWRIAYTATAIFVVALGTVAPGCSSDDSAAPGDGDASTGSPDADTCQLPATNGGPCFPVGPSLCFQECTTGGCICTTDKAHPGADAGLWVCTVDHSCEPDAPPVDFDAPDNPPPDDGGPPVVDASDAGADADADAE